MSAQTAVQYNALHRHRGHASARRSVILSTPHVLPAGHFSENVKLHQRRYQHRPPIHADATTTAPSTAAVMVFQKVLVSVPRNAIPNTLVMRIPPKRSRQGRLHADHAPTPVKSIARHAFARSTVTPPMSAQRLRKDGLWDLDNRNFCYVASAKHIICITTCTCKIRNLLAF